MACSICVHVATSVILSDTLFITKINEKTVVYIIALGIEDHRSIFNIGNGMIIRVGILF